MASFARFGGVVLWVAVASAAGLAACGGNAETSVTNGNTGGGGGHDAGADSSTGGGGATGGASGTGGGFNFDGGSPDAAQGFDVQPSGLQTITVAPGQHAPQVDFHATLDGQPIDAGWTVDRGEIGAIPAAASSTGTFTPTGGVGGLVTITAGLNGQTRSRQVLVKLVGTQSGADPTNPAQVPQIATDPSTLTTGGGIGGVGGEGLGTAVTDPGLLGALTSPASDGSSENLRFLYPYDKTVFPRGILAPLLQWDWSLGDADAIEIELSTASGSFSWTGTFGRPTILTQTGGKFIRHPIPQDVWAMATDSAEDGKDTLTVKLTVALGGQAYGPISEAWTIAPARLSGIIYYNSYGTNLAKNYGGAVGGDHRFGGAVLSIHVGDTGPDLTAGSNGGEAQCRVCHSVSADGSRLVVQHGENYNMSSAYDLSPSGSSETSMTIGATYPGLSPDGALALSPNKQLLNLPAGTLIAGTTGLDGFSVLGTPAFSPDGKRVAFADGANLRVMDFDPATFAFSGATAVASGQLGWPAFLPDSSSLVFNHQSSAGIDGVTSGDLHTRKGAKSQIYWTTIASAADVTPLNALNGLDAGGTPYLPKLSTPVSLSCTGDGAQVGSIDPDHGDDVNLNYEPTVSPIAGGGFAWVVFTSRRMYGSVANIPPFCSDPRGVDLFTNVTTKKLWVAAVDLSAKPGTDASHPAFYLPAQELLAGNSRGFWVRDPCRADGQSCQSGDQCCNGYCQPNAEGALVCSNDIPDNHCSGLQEKCSTAADCCDKTNLCINGFCAQKGPA